MFIFHGIGLQPTPQNLLRLHAKGPFNTRAANTDRPRSEGKPCAAIYLTFALALYFGRFELIGKAKQHQNRLQKRCVRALRPLMCLAENGGRCAKPNVRSSSS
jgi:hypothetical protein